MERPLVSAIVLSYKNFRYLFEAVDSVFQQDYPNIELIICNDGSDDFDESALIQHINHKRGANICHVFIKNHERNLGTVKNFNFAIRSSTGKFLVFLAADDAFYDSTVVSQYVDHLESIGEDAYIANSQVEMFDNQMKTSQGQVCSKEDIIQLKTLAPHDLYRQLCERGFFFPTTCCIRRELMDIIGYVNEDAYRLIEDGPLYLMILRNGIKVHYLDKVTLKHRHGGLVHGNESNGSASLRMYYKDELAILKNEMLPYPNILGAGLHREIQKKYKRLSLSYEYKYEFPKYSPAKRFAFLFRNSPSIVLRLVENIIRNIIRFSEEVRYEAKSNFLIVGAILILLSNFTSIGAETSAAADNFYKHVTLYAGLLSLLFEGYFTLLFITRKIYKYSKQTYRQSVEQWNKLRGRLND